ncbi:MAG: LON peptidase substrate-binding domain-containing protein [Longimicrobiales bacterium]|nr:LON peptidase substrate-binding domain-containing protein [Longimicrobiales bacterium]
MHPTPLFPLPLVVYPGATAPLHIFEPRYRQMVACCLAGGREFGVIHHDPDEAGPFLMEPGRVGTRVRILESRALPEGRSLILVRGMGRFAIAREREMTRPWYEADLLPFEDESVPRHTAICEARRATLELFHAVVERLDDGPEELPEFDLSDDLSFQLAPAVQIDLRWQQSFLELRSEIGRLERLDAVFQAAVEAWRPDRG